MGVGFARTLTLLLWTISSTALAGQTCSVLPLAPVAVSKGLALALKTRHKLDQEDARIVLIGRIGADLSKHGLRYSHAGIARRDHPQGRWLVTHVLNHCGTSSSDIFDEGLGNFFMDDPYIYETVIVVPSPVVQQKLIAALDSRLPAILHTASYSMIAYPFSIRYQNSNQWLLEMVAASMADIPIVSRTAAQSWLREARYSASQVRISAMERVGAGLFKANVRFDDHTGQERTRGLYEIVSVESVLDFLSRLDPGARRFVVVLD